MLATEIIKKLQPWIEANKRPTWKPLVEEGETDTNLSKFGGTPWLAKNENYPCCGECNAKMPLFVQVDLNQVPAELAGKFGQGLLQLFYCTECDSWEYFNHTKLARIIQPVGNAQNLENQDFPSFPAKTIIDWQQFDDYPDNQEYEELGLEIYLNLFPETVRIKCPMVGLSIEDLAPEELEEIDVFLENHSGDKLGGYPYWVQGIEYPNCPICQTRMDLVLQIDSEENLPYMFGDVGCGHITQCPEHKHILTFGWACC
ncbi:MAG TPA: DUF1963 domain-containing protein [Nostocaceae cyanobacterium]|nr:DUF1963 domain-containing protein [Nostocaceae cyanobacterium]